MSGTRDDFGGAQPRPQRRYRIAGGAPAVADRGEHVDDLVAAHALGALDRDERARVERHVRACPRCAGLLDEERRVVALLPLVAVPAAPSPDVKVALFARVAHAQRAAVAADLPAARTLPPTMTIPASRPVTRPAVEAPAVTAPSPRSGERAERPSGLNRIGAFASVPLLLALLATGAWAFQLQDRVAETNGQVASLEASLANFGSATQLPLYGTSATSTEPQGQLLIGNDQRQARLRMRLDPDPDRAYKLIGVQEGRVVDVADLKVDDQGNSQVFRSEEPFDSYEQLQVQVQSPGSGGDASTVLSADLNGAIGADDPTSNSALP